MSNSKTQEERLDWKKIWWMFTKTDIFGILIKKKTGRMPDVMRVDPQWDGKEFLKVR